MTKFKNTAYKPRCVDGVWNLYMRIGIDPWSKVSGLNGVYFEKHSANEDGELNVEHIDPNDVFLDCTETE